jgi:hypothetical protein
VLRYLDRYVTVSQGSVFYITEALAQLEGLERGPAGNTSLTAAFSLARTMGEDQVIVVNETEYTGAGKHPYAQIAFARKMGVEVFRGDPSKEKPGENIVIPVKPRQIAAGEVDLEVTPADLDFICDDARLDGERALGLLAENGVVLSA